MANQNIKKAIEQSDSDDEPEKLQYKIVVLGNGTVGKTSIIMRFCEDYFAKSYKQTIGVDFYMKRLDMPGNVTVAMQLWDIGGQSIFGKMTQTYIYEANAVVFVYDITNQQSFQDLDDWLALVQKTFLGKEMPLLILMANKTDLSHMQAVKQEQHNLYAEQKSMYSFFVSAKSGDMLHSCFYKIAADLAGIQISQPEQETYQQPVTAEVMQPVEMIRPKAPEPEKKEKPKCVIF